MDQTMRGTEEGKAIYLYNVFHTHVHLNVLYI